MAVGVVTASVLQNRISGPRCSRPVLVLAGGALLVATSSPYLPILVPRQRGRPRPGRSTSSRFTLLHENVDDELRGRIFSALLVLVRFCMLMRWPSRPLVSEALDKVSQRWWDGDFDLFGLTVMAPGVRLTLWLARSPS
ncbi:MAG: hypothetical protein R2695_17210 [Acidimicrobiales bacterium]